VTVDGIHSRPNSVRLAYNRFLEGCILIIHSSICDPVTPVRQRSKILDPYPKNGVHGSCDEKRLVKEGFKSHFEGSDTLAGSFFCRLNVVTLDACDHSYSRFTGCSPGEAIKCVTFNPARCLGIGNQKGMLRPGADADLVILNRSGNVLST
ncbi:hypothetical protein BC827DRAFT_1142221, partial [Russula dissimulans]